MAADETKQTEETTTSADAKSTPMAQMMSQMTNACCAGKGGFSDCASMMKEMTEAMKNQSSGSQHESHGESEEKKR